jgi:Protein of unknown function (DUF5818)
MQQVRSLALLAASTLLLVAAGWGQSQSQQPQPMDPTAQQPATSPQTTPPTFPQSTKPGEQQPDPQQPASQSPATQDQGQSSPSTQSSDSTAASTAGQARTFMGTVLKSGDGFILRAGDKQYKLDDQDRAKQFEGKDVKVMGKLDAQSNTIQVQSIESGPSM